MQVGSKDKYILNYWTVKKNNATISRSSKSLRGFKTMREKPGHHEIQIQTRGFTDILDITPQVSKALSESEVTNGILLVFVPGSTAAITTIEFEPGLRKDMPEFFEKIIPQNINYHHDKTWGDGNGYAHVRAALIGPSLSIPVLNKRMTLGTWQQIVLIDFDNRPRQRKVLVEIMGD